MSIHSYLQSSRVSFATFLQRPAATSSRRARSVHLPGRMVAKGVLVQAGERYLLAVLSSTERIDLARLSEVLGGLPARLADEDEVARVFGDCERGAVPPFGRAYGLPTLLESGLTTVAELVCVGNQRHEGIRLSLADYESIEGPLRARFAATDRRERRRRAG